MEQRMEQFKEKTDQTDVYKRKGFVYLASPYSHENEKEVGARVAGVRRAKVWLMMNGWVPYSPIIHWHDSCKLYTLPSDAESWRRQNYTMQRAANGGLIILTLPGWKESKGVRTEIAWAIAWGQDIWMMHENAKVRNGWKGAYSIEKAQGDPRK